MKIVAEKALTLTECGNELGVSERTVKKWIDAGRLLAFITPGVALGAKRRGPKGIRIFPQDWEAFKRANVVTGHVAPLSPDAESPPAHARKPFGDLKGTDGVRRSKRKA